MRVIRLTGIVILFLFSCKNKVSDFLFDASKINHSTKYTYEYKQGKKIYKTEKFYTIMFDQIVDSMISKTTFIYNEKGAITKEITYSGHLKNPDLKLLNYDLNDSLISVIRINTDGDTTLIEKFENFPDGRKMTFHRFVMLKLDPKLDLKTAYKNKTNDTILTKYEYIYENNVCKLLRKYDKTKKLTDIVEYEYKDGKVYKETYYSIINNFKMLAKITYYNYSKSNLIPDYYSLSETNDTIEMKKNELKNNNLSFSAQFRDKGKFIERTYYKNGKMVGIYIFDIRMGRKMSISFSYYDNGDLKEDDSYDEKLNVR